MIKKIILSRINGHSVRTKKLSGKSTAVNARLVRVDNQWEGTKPPLIKVSLYIEKGIKKYVFTIRSD
ncbi:hypothetical protein BAQ44_05515 [Bacillus mobilis]|nr:hypothetical protein BAQ44_05515 [Bacillus mobilis]